MESPELGIIIFDKVDNSDHEICEIKQKNTVIVRKASQNNMSSSKIKLKNIVDYKWELKPYIGRLVAAHKEGNVIAYAIKAKNHGNYEGMIRIVNVENGKRTLLKGMDKEALDLEFAFLTDPILLAYINETTLYVQKIDEADDNLKSSIVFQINDVMDHSITYDKVTWCPYLPESTENDLNASQLITWSRGSAFHCYSISDVAWKYGPGPHKTTDINEGGLTFNEQKSIILDIGFSPDGTTLTTCTEDGFVRFYQVYLHALDGTPRRLHEWKPHDGKSVKQILFLDNLNQSNTDEPLWKNAVTYSEEKHEIKLWCCETWICLQTISFKNIIDTSLFLTLRIDRTATYMLASDMFGQQLYVFHIEKPSAKLQENYVEKVNIKSIAKFQLASHILSFDIVSASIQQYKCGLSDDFLSNAFDEYEDEVNCAQCIILKMFLVQPKSVQECNLLYQPVLKPTSSNNITSTEQIENTNDILNDSQLNNMQIATKTEVQEDFSSIVPVKLEGNVVSTTNNDDLSGKSSPSREVEDILNEIETYESYFDTNDGTVTSKINCNEFQLNDQSFKTEINKIEKDWTSTSQTTPKKSSIFKEFIALINEQSLQLSEIKSMVIDLQKNVNTQNDKPVSAIISDEQLIKYIDKAVQASRKNIIDDITNKFQQKLENFTENIFTQFELYMASKTSGGQKSQTEKSKDQIVGDYTNNAMNELIPQLISTNVVPTFQNIVKEMLHEVNHVFISGTQEYTKLFEKHAKLNSSQIQMREVAQQILARSQSQFSKTEEIMRNNFSTVSKDLKLMELHITKVLKDQIKIEVQTQFEKQATAIQSSVLSVVRSQTPAPLTQNLQNNICKLLEQCQINKAFHLALIANDLSLVEFTIKKANFSSVFQPCSLEQTVLLSLIQQLSADMKSHSEIKQKYLAEAIINLNLEDSSIKEHAPRIMNELRNNCKNFIKENPISYLTSYVKMLILASQSVA